MPESFTGKGDFEDYLQQFNTAALLSGWFSPTHDNRSHYFALRLRENALHFFTTLSPQVQTDYDLLVEAFRQNYTTNGDILKARLKAAKQQPNQDISSFLCDLRTLARRAYRDHPDMIDPTVMTSFIEGLSDKTLRWELRKAKLSTADEALALAMELHSFLEIENGSHQVAEPVNRVSHTSSATAGPEVMAEFVRAFRQELDRGRPQTSGPKIDQENSRPNRSHQSERGRSQSNDSNRSGQSVRFQSDEDRSRSRYRTHDNDPSKRNRDHSPHPEKQNYNRKNNDDKKPCEHCKRENHSSKDCKACFNCLRVGHFRKDCRAKRRQNSLN